MARFQVINYFDVWGNSRDGWEVNNLCREDVVVDIDDADTDEDVIRKLGDAGFLASDAWEQGARIDSCGGFEMIEIVDNSEPEEDEDIRTDYDDSDGTPRGYADHGYGMPICRLERIDDYEVVDFGPGPRDETQGYPFSGTERDCAAWIVRHQAVRADGTERYAMQRIDEEE